MKKTISYLKGRDRLTVVIGNKSTTIAGSDENRIDRVMDLINEYNNYQYQESLDELEEYLFPIQQVVRLSDKRFVWDGKTLKLAGTDKAIPALLMERMLEFMEKNYPMEALINFWKNLMMNPSDRSIQAVYEFIEHHGITITNTGYMVLYKGVKKLEVPGVRGIKSGTQGYYRDKEGKARRPNGSFANRQEIEDFLSGKITSVDSSMVKYVDVHSGTFDNSPGLVVSMPRDKVDDNGDHGCSFGLHVGAYSYASSFGPVCLKVLVNPADVVSVPTDCNFQKIRVCKYFVAEVINEQITESYSDSDYAHLQTADLINQLPFLSHVLFESGKEEEETENEISSN